MTRISLKSNQDGLLTQSSRIREAILKSWLRQTLEKLPEALVSLFAIGVFGSLFFHVFVDIFSPDIARLAPRITSGAALVTSTGLITLVGIGVYSFSRSDVSLGWLDFIPNVHGNKQATENTMFLIKTFIASLGATIVTGTLWNTGLWHLATSTPTGGWPVPFLICLLCYTAAIMGTESKSSQTSPQWRTKITRKFESTLQQFPLTSGTKPLALLPPLTQWRLGLLVRTPLTWVFWLTGMIVAGGFAIAAANEIPAPFLGMIAWLGGWIVSLPHAFQAANESEGLGFEKGLGVTHARITNSHYSIITITTLASGCVTAALLAISWLLPDRSGASIIPALVAMIPGSLMACLLWQIDVRRPLVQVLTTLMSSLFLATAIIASKTALLLWPVMIIYLLKHQAGRIEQLETRSPNSPDHSSVKSGLTSESSQGSFEVIVDELKVIHNDSGSGNRRFELGPITKRIAPGTCLAILGPNGSGKSTFFQTLTGNKRPTSGNIVIAPTIQHDAEGSLQNHGRQNHARRIGYLPQQNQLPPWATAYELCQFSAGLNHADQSMTRRVLDYWDCVSFMDQPTARLSIGMRKRVGLAIATLSNPGMLVLDEPFEALDLGHIAALKQEISRRSAAGLITIFATHIASYASELATAAWFFDGGKVVEMEWPSSVDDRNRIVTTKFKEVAPPPTASLHAD